MGSESGTPAVRLARRLRELREHEWRDLTITQADLARALSAQSKVTSTTVSSWESLTNDKAPTTARLNAYARFFATRRSMEGEGAPRLLALDNLTDDERERFDLLEEELFRLHGAITEILPTSEKRRRALLSFVEPGPVVIVCPEAPAHSRGPLADASSLNHTRLHRFADADAMLELFGHVRALNPERHVLRRLPDEMAQTDLQNHIVLVGGIGWNSTLRRILFDLERNLPIEQIEDERVAEGEVSGSRRTPTARSRPTSRSGSTMNGRANSSRTWGYSHACATRSTSVAR